MSQSNARALAAPRALEAVTGRRVLAIAVVVALTAVSARLSVPLPGGLVPISMQTLVVLLAGMLLGPRLGAASMTAYLAAGAAGLPVFVAGGGLAYLAGPTGGYLLSFPVAAAAAGFIADRRDDVAGLVLAGAAASILVFLGGWAQLSLFTGATAAFATGVLPFIAGGVAKLAVAVVVAMKARTPLRNVR